MTINVCFHGIGTLAREREPGESGYWVSADLFKRVLDLVADRPDVRLSFDDGNVSDVERALPGLLDRGLTATFFVLGSRLDTAGSLASADVRALVAAGMTVGSHGMDHHPWPGLDDAGLHRELVLAGEVLAEVSGRAVTHAACPLGRYDRRVLRELRKHGYSWIGTSDRMPARQHHWLQPRFSVRADDTPSSFEDEVLRPMPARRLAARAAKSAVKRLR